jgi:hypothetical protein
MPQIINPFRPQNTPLAQAITQVGKDIYGDQLTPALKREQLIAAQRGNVETDALAQSFADPAGKLDFQAGILSGYKPSDMADMRRLQMADTYGARDQRTQNAQIGAGSPFTATAEAFDTNVATDRRGQDIASSDRRYGINVGDATERYKFANTPEEALVNGQPVFLPREKVYGAGVSPILSDAEKGRNMRFNESVALYGEVYPESTMEQRKQYALQQESKSQGQKITIGPDGTTIESGGIYGEPTNSVKSGKQENLSAADAFDASIEDAKDIAARSPEAFGPLGTVTGWIQDGMAIAENVGLISPNVDFTSEAVEAEQFLASKGISREVFGPYNPDISNIDALAQIMVYQAAQSLTQQTGRSVSNEDAQRMAEIVSDPKGWTMNPKKFAERMDMLQKFVDGAVDRDRAMLNLPPDTERAARRQKRNAARAAAPGAPAPGGNKRIRFNPATGDFEE